MSSWVWGETRGVPENFRNAVPSEADRTDSAGAERTEGSGPGGLARLTEGGAAEPPKCPVECSGVPWPSPCCTTASVHTETLGQGVRLKPRGSL